MKELKKYRVKRAYGMLRVGDIVTPTGMRRDELKNYGFIEAVPDAPAPAPVVAEPEPEPEPVLIEEAVTPRAWTAEAPRRDRGRPRNAR